MNQTILAFSTFMFFIVHNGHAQYLSNGSFETLSSGPGLFEDWSVCNQGSSPDIQPGAFEVKKPASDGSRYLTLVTRAKVDFYAYLTEDIETELLDSLITDSCYYFSVDLYRTKEFVAYVMGSGDILWGEPTILRVYGGASACDTSQVLWESDPIRNTEWETYRFSFTPKETIKFIRIEVDYMPGEQPYFSALCVDNLVLSTESSVPEENLIVSYEEQVIVEFPEGDEWVSGSWISDDFELCETCYSNEFDISHSGKMEAVMLSTDGCTVNYPYQLLMKPFLPNVFTPNNDGHNDDFRLLGLSEGELLVYNRWGALIFNNPIGPVWSGRTQSGVEAGEGVYFYKYVSESQTLSGEVQLLR